MTVKWRDRFRAIWPTTVQGRDRLRIGSILVGATLLGYLLTCVAYPAPLISRDHAVARVLGLPRAAAEKELEVQGFKTKVDGEAADPVIPAGHILWQDPPPETEMTQGALVTLTVSSGPGPSGRSRRLCVRAGTGRQVLEAAGLRIGSVGTNVAETGVIVATRPAAGASRPPGSAIDLVVSRGPASIRIPDLIGLRQEEARERLESAGLRLGTITTVPARRGPVGVVVDQRPASGALAPTEGRVSLVISN